ncbi:MAG TPA: transcriptional regulator, partial [Spirochaetia bacterium]|nr:transcriptional regulator [Spirochaetia bacterium]
MTLKETTYSILIIDDEKNIREGLKKALSFYNIFTAENGKDGYKIFLSEKIDLVITDLRMPETDGFELLDKILKE